MLREIEFSHANAGDVRARCRYEAFFTQPGPIATDAPQQTTQSLDHLIGGGEQRRRHGETQRPRDLEIDGEMEFGWLLPAKRWTRIA
jgi:hypothetical protein